MSASTELESLLLAVSVAQGTRPLLYLSSMSL